MAACQSLSIGSLAQQDQPLSTLLEKQLRGEGPLVSILNHPRAVTAQRGCGFPAVFSPEVGLNVKTPVQALSLGA